MRLSFSVLELADRAFILSSIDAEVLSCAETAHGWIGVVRRRGCVGTLEADEAVAAVLGAGGLAELVIVVRVGAWQTVIYGSSA